MNDIAILGPLWAAAHALYLGSAAFVLRRAATGPGTLRAGRTARVTALILVVGLVPRLLLLPAAPSRSEDLYRYLWDGRLAAHGVNPFSRPPSDASFAGDRGDLYGRLNHAEVRTIYPPVAQLLFALAWGIGGTPLVWKAVLFGLEGALVAGLLVLLGRRRLPPDRLLLYYWNPLVVVECYGDGHVDLAAAAFLVLALVLLEPSRTGRPPAGDLPTGSPAKGRRRQILAGAAFGAATLVKLVPLILVPALARKRAWTALASAALLAALLYLPFRSAGAMLWEGLRVYARHWEFNGPLYTLIRPLFRDGDAPRLILAAALALAVAAIARRARTLSGAALASWIAFVLLSPTVYPWYLAPAIALLPLHADAGLLVLSGTVALSYLPLSAFRASGAWTVPPWILWAEYALPAALWIGTAVHGRLRGGRGSGGEGPQARRAL